MNIYRQFETTRCKSISELITFVPVHATLSSRVSFPSSPSRSRLKKESSIAKDQIQKLYPFDRSPNSFVSFEKSRNPVTRNRKKGRKAEKGSRAPHCRSGDPDFEHSQLDPMIPWHVRLATGSKEFNGIKLAGFPMKNPLKCYIATLHAAGNAVLQRGLAGGGGSGGGGY